MLSNNLSVGQVVKATSGKEKDKLFFIIKVVDHQYVLIADGKKRKLGKPKLKKVKHLEIYNVINNKVNNKISSEQNVTDVFLRVELTKLNDLV
ncbi:KOW domain-containing RNA-binding protein [Romboutsia sedimentorum]|uniref:KOW domain-containing RNA-binding protein n=1 Tax=Romboutsia sedimentorum TaxID=1368474 RepID=A0ABT7EDC7_9FIRM|nr:KOW domain-containing RNA-binding protein [Romboutsia sedimentorum]MDK2564932.1 KOW domain-containing RNA-binding protein [Romboutsia sedimentorum]MDK2587162.1 KOW domain-containing RNA-binding protein [Romboutsia sedimentorum]